MAEAKLTERLNLASLKKYEEMELEAKRKAMRSGKREIKGPVIRLGLCFRKVQYHSNQDTLNSVSVFNVKTAVRTLDVVYSCSPMFSEGGGGEVCQVLSNI